MAIKFQTLPDRATIPVQCLASGGRDLRGIAAGHVPQWFPRAQALAFFAVLYLAGVATGIVATFYFVRRVML